MPMFVATAKRVSGVDEVCIALDDERVLNIAKEYGLNAVLTSKEHESGTDRINEACKKLALKMMRLLSMFKLMSLLLD